MFPLDDVIYIFIGCIGLGILIYIALYIRDIYDLIKDIKERRTK